jgi:hypothetical protein
MSSRPFLIHAILLYIDYMNSEKAKQSKNGQGSLARAGCSAVSLIAAVLLGFAVVIYGGAIIVTLFFLIALSDSPSTLIAFFTVLSVVVLASIVGVVFVGGKSIEHLTHVVVRSWGMQHEQKRIEHLMTQAEAGTATKTDTLDYLADAENVNKEMYS